MNPSLFSGCGNDILLGSWSCGDDVVGFVGQNTGVGWMSSSIIRRETQFDRGADQRGFDVALECSTAPKPTVLGFLMLDPTSADLQTRRAK